MKTKAELPDCPVATTVELIGSKWKLLIRKLEPIIMQMASFGEEYRK